MCRCGCSSTRTDQLSPIWTERGGPLNRAAEATVAALLLIATCTSRARYKRMLQLITTSSEEPSRCALSRQFRAALTARL